jgi:sigma-B regulation protein RsbU (phosphoserine phosphatase)
LEYAVHTLAALSFARYTKVSHSIITGDLLVLYADGVLDAVNADDEEFGEEGLGALLRATAILIPAETADRCGRPLVSVTKATT